MFVCEIAKILGSRLELTSVGKIPAITQMYMLSNLRSNYLSKYLGVLELFDLRLDNMYVCVIAGILSTEVNSIRLPKVHSYCMRNC